MKRSYLVLAPFFLLGVGCIALAHQQRHTIPPKAPLMESIIKDTETGRKGREAETALLIRIQPMLKQGQAAVAKGQYAQAEGIFRQVLQLQGHDARTWLLLADVYERQGKEAKALEAYRTLLYPVNWGSSISSDVTTRMRYVLALCRSNRYEEAAQVFDKAMNATVLENIADALREQIAQTHDAMTQEDAVEAHSLLPLRFDPASPDKRLLQAAAHYVLGTKQPSFGPPGAGEQMKHLQAAVRLAPQWGQAHSALSDALQRQGQTQAAQTAQKRALALGDHSSLKERLIHANDEGQHAHQLLYHPDHPEYYHYHDPKMIPTKAEVDAALIELKKRNAANLTSATGH